MGKLILTLITGRSTKQGVGISTGKDGAGYKEATGVVELSRTDMVRLGLSDGDQVRIENEFEEAEFRCREGDVPEGLAFVAFGSACNRLIGGETYASGMPDSKHLKVTIERQISPQRREERKGAPS
jgi:formylmethanofuran dehydrogenase subunit D